MATEKKKPKFVPSRLKSKSNFYLRGEMLKIRDSIDNSAWRRYAEQVFDMNAEPFHVVLEDDPEETIAEEAQSTVSLMVDSHEGGSQELNEAKEAELVAKLSSMSVSQPAYTREEILGIKNQHDSKYWQNLAAKTWNTKEEPFELDKELQCPFAERLRVLRERERQARKKVIEMRKQPDEVTWEDIKNRFIAENSVTSSSKTQQIEVNGRSAEYWAKKAEQWIQNCGAAENKENISGQNLKKSIPIETHNPSKLIEILESAAIHREKILSQPNDVFHDRKLAKRRSQDRKLSSTSSTNSDNFANELQHSSPTSTSHQSCASENFLKRSAYNMDFARTWHNYVTTSCYRK